VRLARTMAGPARRHAIYDDLREVPPHLVGCVQCRRLNPIALPFVVAEDRESHRVSALFEETPHTRTVDFHSRRRAHSQVLATPGRIGPSGPSAGWTLSSMPMRGT
jgi:hypothetical protein